MYKYLNNEEITIWGDGSIVRDYVNVIDVARACLLASLSNESGVFNVGSGVGLSLKNLLATLENVVGLRPNIKWLPGRGVDVPEIVLDCSLIYSELSWKPHIELSVGLFEMKKWMCSLIEDSHNST
jgi:UDP-glucose 4-epimerase